MTALSSWQVNQWAEIKRQVSYSVQCRLCGWADGTGSRRDAEDLYREHYQKEHSKAVDTSQLYKPKR